MNTTNTATRLIAGVIFTAVISSLGAVASAADSATDKTVKYADLNISSAQGATMLYKRIRSAAADVCARFDHGDLSSKASFQLCASKAIAQAVSDVNSPALTAVYKEKTGQSSPLYVAAR